MAKVSIKDFFGSTFRTWGAAIAGGFIGALIMQKSIEYGIDPTTIQNLAEVFYQVAQTETGQGSIVSLIALKVLSVANKAAKNKEKEKIDDKVHVLESKVKHYEKLNR